MGKLEIYLQTEYNHKYTRTMRRFKEKDNLRIKLKIQDIRERVGV